MPRNLIVGVGKHLRVVFFTEIIFVFSDCPVCLEVGFGFPFSRSRDRDEIIRYGLDPLAANWKLNIGLRLDNKRSCREHRVRAYRDWRLDAIVNGSSSICQNFAKCVSREWIS